MIHLEGCFPHTGNLPGNCCRQLSVRQHDSELAQQFLEARTQPLLCRDHFQRGWHIFKRCQSLLKRILRGEGPGGAEGFPPGEPWSVVLSTWRRSLNVYDTDPGCRVVLCCADKHDYACAWQQCRQTAASG